MTAIARIYIYQSHGNLHEFAFGDTLRRNLYPHYSAEIQSLQESKVLVLAARAIDSLNLIS